MRSSDILIVDDEVGIRDLLSEILQDEGYSVTLAENAEEARQLRNQTRPTMVLLDIWMPDCDGITLLKEWAKSGQLNMPPKSARWISWKNPSPCKSFWLP